MTADGKLRVWTVSADRPEILARCVGVAQFIDPRPRRVMVRRPLAFWRKARLSPHRDMTSPPEIIVSCGEVSVGHVRAVAAACALRPFLAHLSSPSDGGKLFDLAFVPRHEWDDRASADARCREMVGVTHEVTREMLATLRPRARMRWKLGESRTVAVQAADPADAYAYDDAASARLIRSVAALAEAGWTVLALVAAEAPADLVTGLNHLGNDRIITWDGSGENPYRDFLAAADAHLIVKGSIPLCCEALATGRPVFLFDPAKRDGVAFERAERFYRDISDTLRLARTFEDAIYDYTYTPLAEGERIASIVKGEAERLRPDLMSANEHPSRKARDATSAAALQKRQLARGHTLPGFETSYRSHHEWLAAQGLLGRPWLVLGAAPDPAIPSSLPPGVAYVYVRFSGRSARRHGLPVGDLTLLPRWKDAQRDSGLDFKAILRIRSATTFREKVRRFLRRAGGTEAEISTPERDDYIIKTLGSLFPKIEKRPSNGIALVCFALAHGVEDVVIAGISFEGEGHEYEASKRPRRHIDEDRAALQEMAARFPRVSTTEASLHRATGIPLYKPVGNEG